MFSSILTNPMKRGMLISPSGCRELLSRTYVEWPPGASTSATKKICNLATILRGNPHHSEVSRVSARTD
jgi:hypothetical protein